MCTNQRRRGFTLVELLVVIGIIALLISILLPSLNKARQAANSLICQSGMKQVGMLMQLYATNNKGFFPPASITYVAGGGAGWSNPGPNPGPVNPQNCTHGEGGVAVFWPDLLTLLVQKRTIQDVQGFTGAGTGNYIEYTNLANCGLMAADYLPIFHDVDIDDASYRPRVSTFNVNMRIIAPENCRDRNTMASQGAGNSNGLPGGQYVFHHVRQIGGIKRAAEVMAMWDAPLCRNGGTIQINQYDAASWTLDASAYGSGHCYCYPQAPLWSNFTAYNNRIGYCSDGTLGASYGSPLTKTSARLANVDDNPSTLGSHSMRFRHINNTSMNALFADGHCEARKIMDVYARDICVNPK